MTFRGMFLLQVMILCLWGYLILGDVTKAWSITDNCSGPEKMVQYPKCSPRKPEDGSLDHQCPCKCWVSMVACLQSQKQRGRQEVPGGKLASQTSTVGSLWVQWKILPASMNKVESHEENS